MQHLNTYELAVEKSLHGTADEKRLANAYIELYERIRDNSEDCIFCGSPSS